MMNIISRAGGSLFLLKKPKIKLVEIKKFNWGCNFNMLVPLILQVASKLYSKMFQPTAVICKNE